MAAWIPWLLAASSVWRLWTAKGKVDREHYELMHDRMSGASLFLMGFHGISVIGCITRLSGQSASVADHLVCFCCLAALLFSTALFSRRKELEMTRVENPEKSHKAK